MALNGVNPAKLKKWKPLQDCSKTFPNIDIIFVADSQGIRIDKEIKQYSLNRIKTSSYVIPNTLLKVIEYADRAGKTLADTGEKTPVIIMGGTLDSLKGNFMEIYKNLEDKLKVSSSERPVFLTTVPRRFDMPLNDPVNVELTLLNNYISELAIRANNVYVIDLSNLQRYHFSTPGLYLNDYGKIEVAHLIVDTLTFWYMEEYVLAFPTKPVIKTVCKSSPSSNCREEN